MTTIGAAGNRVRGIREGVACGAEKKILSEVWQLSQLSALHSDRLIETMVRSNDRQHMRTALLAGDPPSMHDGSWGIANLQLKPTVAR
jgi:hypothetical protein